MRIITRGIKPEDLPGIGYGSLSSIFGTQRLFHNFRDRHTWSIYKHFHNCSSWVINIIERDTHTLWPCDRGNFRVQVNSYWYQKISLNYFESLSWNSWIGDKLSYFCVNEIHSFLWGVLWIHRRPRKPNFLILNASCNDHHFPLKKNQRINKSRKWEQSSWQQSILLGSRRLHISLSIRV